MYNIPTKEKIEWLIENKRCPIKYYINCNKILATFSYVGLKEKVDWVLPKEAVDYLPIYIENLTKQNNLD